MSLLSEVGKPLQPLHNKSLLPWQEAAARIVGAGAVTVGKPDRCEHRPDVGFAEGTVVGDDRVVRCRGASARFRVVVLDPQSQTDRGDPRLG